MVIVLVAVLYFDVCLRRVSRPSTRGSSLIPSRKCRRVRCTCKSWIERNYRFSSNVQSSVPIRSKHTTVLRCWPYASPSSLEFAPMQIHVVQKEFDHETLWVTRIRKVPARALPRSTAHDRCTGWLIRDNRWPSESRTSHSADSSQSLNTVVTVHRQSEPPRSLWFRKLCSWKWPPADALVSEGPFGCALFSRGRIENGRRRLQHCLQCAKINLPRHKNTVFPIWSHPRYCLSRKESAQL